MWCEVYQIVLLSLTAWLLFVHFWTHMDSLTPGEDMHTSFDVGPYYLKKIEPNCHGIKISRRFLRLCLSFSLYRTIERKWQDIKLEFAICSLIYFTRDRGELFWNCSKSITVMTCFEMVGKKNIFLRCCLCFVWFFFCAFPSHETIGLNFQDNFVASWYAHKHRANKASFWQFCFLLLIWLENQPD